MRIFITGGAGYVGTAVTRDLAAHGHDIAALARSPAHEARLRALGATPVRGDLAEASTYQSVAAGADAIVHLANPGGDAGRSALEHLLDAARSGRVRQFVYTSVLFVLGDVPGGADEETAPSGSLYAARAGLESLVAAKAGEGLTWSVVRPGMVYGGGEGGAVSEMFKEAGTGAVRYVGGGENRWSLVHRDDVAALFRIVLEKNAAGVFHATDGVPLRVRDVAQHVASAAEAPRVESIPLDVARGTLGVFADALCLDQPVESRRSLALGWSPAWTSFAACARAAFEEFESSVR